ncbi:MAG: hypothetical protein RMJ87_04130 [Cytophagales bacterium]|nr:hypothetical protein [Bernardetiaceae bacterium]MDW8204197.1 hypothetical protein [Cytophagales bacterium]
MRLANDEPYAIAWNCRCNLVETNRAATDAPLSAKALRSNFPNSYFDAAIFPENHRTFGYVPARQPDFAADALRAAQVAIARQRQYADLVNQVHTPVAFSYQTGGYATAHPEHHRKDFTENAAASKLLAENGYIVQINRHVEGKKTELTINGAISDLKKPDKVGPAGIKNGFASAQEQKIHHVVIAIQKMDALEIMCGLRNGFTFSKKIE